jgi:hypothetical protein
MRRVGGVCARLASCMYTFFSPWLNHACPQVLITSQNNNVLQRIAHRLLILLKTNGISRSLPNNIS